MLATKEHKLHVEFTRSSKAGEGKTFVLEVGIVVTFGDRRGERGNN